VMALMEYLKGKTLVLITHKPSLLALVERIVVLDAGKVVADGPKEKVLQALSQNEQRQGQPQQRQQQQRPAGPAPTTPPADAGTPPRAGGESSS
jgi:ATP-binding cassette subfamily C protein LapB